MLAAGNAGNEALFSLIHGCVCIELVFPFDLPGGRDGSRTDLSRGELAERPRLSVDHRDVRTLENKA